MALAAVWLTLGWDLKMANTKSIGVAYSDQAISGGFVDGTPIGAVTPSTVVGTSCQKGETDAR